MVIRYWSYILCQKRFFSQNKIFERKPIFFAENPFGNFWPKSTNFKPFFTIQNVVEPLNPAGLLPMTIKIKNCSHDSDESVEWSVGDNRSAWAICGKTRGLLSIESEKIKEVKVDLMPLFQGSLRLPQEQFVFMFYRLLGIPH